MRRAIAAVPILLSALPAPAEVRLEYFVPYRTGDPAPGLPAGWELRGVSGSSGDAALNDHGQIAFNVILRTDTGATSSGLFAGTPESFAPVRVLGFQAPGLPAGVVYTDDSINSRGPRGVVLTDQGRLAFWNRLGGAGVTTANNNAYFSGTIAGGVLPRVRLGEQAPGFPAGENALDVNPTRLRYADPGTLGFWTRTTSNLRGFINLIEGGPAYSVKNGDPFFSTGQTIQSLDLDDLQLSTSGATAFLGSLDNGTRVLFAGPITGLNATTNASGPDDRPGLDYNVFSDSVRITPTNAMTFGVRYTNGLDGIVGGTFTGQDTILTEGDPVPGLPDLTASILPTGFQGFEIDDQANLALGVVMTGPGVTSANDTVILYGGPRSLVPVIREGDQVPGLPGGVLFGDVRGPGIWLNNSGQAVFYVSFTGAGVTTNNDIGLVFKGRDNDISTIFRQGDFRPTNRGTLFYKIPYIGPQPGFGSTNTGRARRFNDRGEFLLNANLGSGGETTTVIRITEPCSVADLTTTNTNPGDPLSGIPDGVIDGADLSAYVELWLASEPDADLTTTNVNPGDPAYGEPDGAVDGADLSFFVESWLAGCP